MFKFTLLNSEYFGRIDRGCAKVSCEDLESGDFEIYQFFFTYSSGEWEFYYTSNNMPENEFLKNEMEKWFVLG